MRADVRAVHRSAERAAGGAARRSQWGWLRHLPGTQVPEQPGRATAPVVTVGTVRKDDPMSDTITITGNIAADPERRITGTGVPITTFRVASSQRRFDRASGQWVETGTNWYQVSAFRSLAMHAFASLHRGERVIVTGRLRLRAWETATKKGLSVEIDADGIGHDLLWGHHAVLPGPSRTRHMGRLRRSHGVRLVGRRGGRDDDVADRHSGRSGSVSR